MSVYVDIEKRLGKFLLKVKLRAEEETLALLGASGCGKSMTLKCIAGIEKPDKGKIVVDGITLFDSEKKINLSPQERRTGLMFQNYALFPNMTVLENISLGTKREKNKRERRKRVEAVMEAFGLGEYASRLPHTLSGGQQQRVALARILVSEPRILLLDEPFSALDSHLRFRLEQEVRQVIREFGKTVILVSHDRNEVFRMADRVAVLERGVVVETGEKHRLFASPGTLQAARLIGCENITAIQKREDLFYASAWDMQMQLFGLPPEVTALGIRAEDIQIDQNGQAYRIKDLIENTTSRTLVLESDNEKGNAALWLAVPKDFPTVNMGQKINISIPREKLLFLRDGSERNCL